MKKIISLSLAVLLLVALLLTTTSCGMGMEGMTGYTRLRDHVASSEDGTIELEGKSLGFASVKLTVPTAEGEDTADEVHVVAEGTNQTNAIYLTLVMNGSPEKAKLIYQVINKQDQTIVLGAEATVLLTHYTGNDVIEFTSVTNIRPTQEQAYRESVTSMFNSLLMVLDGYTTQMLDMDAHELGFIVLSEKYMAPKDAVEQDEDLGGAFSSARLTKAGLMLLQGMGMVFLVLAILWLVLIIFKKLLYKGDSKTEKPKKTTPPVEVAPAPPASPVAPTDDAQLIAVITAAVAAVIESDEDLSAEFIGGFRVVSFQKKSGKTSWNH